MAVVDDKTPFLQLPLPHAQNNSNEDVERLRDAYLMLDAFAEALSIAVAGKAAQNHQHEMDTIIGLIDALAGKAAKDHQHTLESLTDTDVAGATNGHFLKRVGTKWQPGTVQPGDVPSFEEAINARLPLTGGNLTGPLMAIDRLVAQATANGNAHVWLRNSAGKNRGLVYWDRNSGAVSLRVYADDGNGNDIVVGNLVLHANGTMTFNNNMVWHSGNADAWAMQPLRVPIPVFDHLEGGAPPTDRGYRYIKLTAGETGPGGYNNGVLTSESVSGSAPLIIATAIVSLSGSPLEGQTIPLINTERRFVRAGSSGELQNDAFQSHLHGPPPGVAGYVTWQSNSLGSSGAVVMGVHSNTGGPVEHSGYGAPRVATETRPRNIAVPYYMRIK